VQGNKRLSGQPKNSLVNENECFEVTTFKEVFAMDVKTAITLAKMHIGKVLTDTNLLLQYMQVMRSSTIYIAIQQIDEELSILEETERKYISK
jgi:hypothetical protein